MTLRCAGSASILAFGSTDWIALVTDLAYESVAAPRFRALVVALLGLAALILVAGGIYALTLFNVLKRTREIGLRAALGPSAWPACSPLVRNLTKPPQVMFSILSSMSSLPGSASWHLNWGFQRWEGQEGMKRNL